MQSAAQAAPVSKTMFWAGWVLTALPSLFLLMDGVMKLVKPQVVVDKTVELGYPESVILPLGMVLLACTVALRLSADGRSRRDLADGLPRRRRRPATCGPAAGRFPVFFPVVFGALLWGGLVLRDARLRCVLPWRR